MVSCVLYVDEVLVQFFVGTHANYPLTQPSTNFSSFFFFFHFILNIFHCVYLYLVEKLSFKKERNFSQLN